MFKIFVPNDYENDNIVEIWSDEDNKTTSRKMDIDELNSWLEESKTNKDIVIDIDYKLAINQVSLEEYDGEYDVIVNTYTYTNSEIYGLMCSYSDKHIKTYKNRKSAEKCAKQQTKGINTLWKVEEV